MSKPVPGNHVAHSRRSVAPSWTASRGVLLGEICAVASRSAPCTFANFYRVSVTAPAPLGSAVLSAAGSGGDSVESFVPLMILVIQGEDRGDSLSEVEIDLKLLL